MLSPEMAIFALEATPVEVYWTDLQARIVEVNPAACKALGYSREALISLTLADIDPLFTEGGWLAFLQDVRRGGKGERESIHRRRDGSEYTVEIAASLLKTGDRELVCGLARDISDRKELERQSAHVSQLYHSALDSPAIGFWAVDPTGRLVDVNQTYQRLSGYDREELLSMTVADLDAKEDAAAVAHRAEILSEEKVETFRTVHRRKDGLLWPVEVSVSYSTINDGTYFVFLRDIRGLVEQERELAAKSSQLERVLVQHHEAQVVARLGHYSYDFQGDHWSSSLELDAIFGIEPDYPRTLAGWIALIDPDQAEDMRTYLEREVVAEGGVFDRMYAVIDQTTGRRKWVHGKGVLKVDAGGKPLEMFGTIQDISARKAMEEALLASERLRRGIVDTLPDLVWLKDVNGVYLACNPRFERLFGAKEAEIVGKTDADFVSADLVASFRIHDRIAIEAGQPMVNEEWLTFADNGERALHETIKTPLRSEDGRVIGVLGIARDITERKRVENDLIRKNDELRRSNADLESFAYAAAHDLREPLRSVTSFSTLLGRSLDGRLNKAERDYLAFVHDSALRMDRLIRDLLDYARAGLGAVPREAVATGPMIERALVSLRTALGEVGAKVEVADDPPWILAQGEEVEQVFLNLLGNAVKYVSDERPPRISVSWVPAGEDWEFIVRDNGIGIPPGMGYEERIFRLFQRLHARGARGGGTGIGLAIAKKIVERQGGRIWLDNKMDAGCAFHFTLPRAEPPSTRPI
jgi:PAS domain S-box-containing protein